jgi:hypothetical protein
MIGKSQERVYGKLEKKKRFNLLRINDYEDKICWKAMNVRAVPDNKKNVIKQIKEGLKEKSIDKNELLETLKEFMKWDRTDVGQN